MLIYSYSDLVAIENSLPDVPAQIMRSLLSDLKAFHEAFGPLREALHINEERQDPLSVAATANHVLRHAIRGKILAEEERDGSLAGSRIQTMKSWLLVTASMCEEIDRIVSCGNNQDEQNEQIYSTVANAFDEISDENADWRETAHHIRLFVNGEE